MNLIQPLQSLRHFSETLLEKFALCLNELDRVTDAISTAQRLAKQYPNNGYVCTCVEKARPLTAR